MILSQQNEAGRRKFHPRGRAPDNAGTPGPSHSATARNSACGTQVTEFPQLPDQVEFLAQLIEDFYSGLSPDIPYTAIAEAAFALSYLRKGIDIIPDSISGVGYADDAAIINVVFETYKQPFLDHVLARKTREESL